MNLFALATFVIAVAIALAVMVVVERRRTERAAKKTIDQIVGPGEGARAKLFPESLTVVEVTEWGVTCTSPNGPVERVAWDDLQKVELVNTDEGPFVPDVFWVLHGSTS